MLRVAKPFEYDRHDPSKVRKVSVLNENLSFEDFKEKTINQPNVKSIKSKESRLRSRKRKRF